MMTIDEAIEHAEHVAASCDGKCSEDHRQLSEWLKELRQWHELVEGIDLRPASLMKPFQPNDLERENDRLEAENAKLRMCLGDGCADCAVGMGEYADSLCDPLKAENAKLRELCADMLAQLLNAYDPKELTEFFDRMHGVGIEVNG